MALAWFRPLLWGILALTWAFLLVLGRYLHLRWWPAWFLRCLLIGSLALVALSLAGGVTGKSFPSMEVMLLDHSDSVDPLARQAGQAAATAWAQRGTGRLVVVFGAAAEVVRSNENEWPAVDGSASDLTGALSMAQGLLGGAPGRVIVATDGRADFEAQVSDLAEEMVASQQRVDIVRTASRSPDSDIALGPLRGPTTLWEGSPFSLSVEVIAPAQMPATVFLRAGPETIAERSQVFPAGRSYLAFDGTAPAAGILALAAEVSSEADPFSGNNRAFATIRVLAAPRVLLVSSSRVAADGLLPLLGANGATIDILSPAELPTSPRELSQYQVFVMQDVLVVDLHPDQMRAIESSVTQGGTGLVVLGGTKSYTLGGYEDSPLESILPVRMEPPPRGQHTPITLLIMLDSSSSMANAIGGVPVIRLAQEAALRALDVMEEKDTLGVLTFSGQPRWEVQLTQVSTGAALRKIKDAVARIVPSGSTEMYEALQTAARALASGTNMRHVIILSDGYSGDGSDAEFRALAQAMRTDGITVSTLALGRYSNQQLMGLLAEEGGGRLFPVPDPGQLPEVLVAETRAARGENVQQGETSIDFGDPGHPVLFGLESSALPNLWAYNALTSRADEGAEDILVSSSFGDPLLSAWQVGLGRVVAWMSDIGGEWSPGWLESPAGASLWSNVLRYASPDPAHGREEFEVLSEHGRQVFHLALRDSLGTPIDFAEVVLVIQVDGQEIISTRLDQSGPGEYRGSLTLDQPGAYTGLLTCRYGANDPVEIPVGFTVSYPSEWTSSLDALQFNALEELAIATGGGYIEFADLDARQQEDARQAESDRGWVTLLVLAGLWPAEIAVRRRWLPWNT